MGEASYELETGPPFRRRVVARLMAKNQACPLVATARGNFKKRQCSSPWVKLGSCVYAPVYMRRCRPALFQWREDAGARVSNVARGGLRVRPSQTQQLIELYHPSVRYHSLNG